MLSHVLLVLTVRLDELNMNVFQGVDRIPAGHLVPAVFDNALCPFCETMELVK